MKLTDASHWKKSYDKPRQHIKKQRYHFADKGPYSQSYDFSSSQVQMWELDHREGWAPKNWCFWTVVLEKTLESPLDCKEIKSVSHKGINPYLEGLILKLKRPIFWPPYGKSRLIGKDLDAEKDWRQEEKGTTENEMFGWHHRLNRHEFGQTSGDSGGQWSLVCCSPWGHRVGHDWVIEQWEQHEDHWQDQWSFFGFRPGTNNKKSVKGSSFPPLWKEKKWGWSTVRVCCGPSNTHGEDFMATGALSSDCESGTLKCPWALFGHQISDEILIK